MAGFTTEQRTELKAELAELRQGLVSELVGAMEQLLDAQRTSILGEVKVLMDDQRISIMAEVRAVIREELRGVYERLDRLEALVDQIKEDLEPALLEIEAIKARVRKLEQLVRTSLRAKAA